MRVTINEVIFFVAALAAMLAVPLAVPLADASEEVYLEIEVSELEQLAQIAELASIDRVDGWEDGHRHGYKVFVYLLSSGLGGLDRLGLRWKQRPHPGLSPGVRMGLLSRASIGAWDAYPTYSEYVSMMQGFAADYPDLCRLHLISMSSNAVRPHEVLAIQISDNPWLEEDEPEIFLSSTMHGDETVGYVLLLRLAHTLLSAASAVATSPDAGLDPELARLARLVSETEIWINPLANPDGAYYSGDGSVEGAIRSYALSDGSPSGVDPNRNFPDPDDGENPDGNPTWLETRGMIDLAEAQRFVISANLHGGAEVVNYPWDTWQRRHADDAWLRSVARAWADEVQAAAAAAPYFDQTYMRDLENGITNGFDWYSISGGRQDHMTYFHGGREMTIEVSSIKNPPASLLERYWAYNRGALIRYIERSLEGARGLVTGQDGAPLDASVEVAWLDSVEDRSMTRTDPAVGDYHRLLLPGEHWLVVRAEGYVSELRRVEVGSGPAARADLVLEEDQGLEALLSISVRDVMDGRPVEGAQVRLAGPADLSGQTADDGELHLGQAPLGAYLVEVEASGYGEARAVHQVDLPASRLEVRLSGPAPPPRRAGGRVAF